MITDGIMIFTELKKPTWIPLHDNPVQADDHAFTHAAIVGVCGNANMFASRISGMPFSDVTSMT